MFENLVLLLVAVAYAYAIRICVRYQVNGIQKGMTIKTEKPVRQEKPAKLIAPIYNFNLK